MVRPIAAAPAISLQAPPKYANTFTRDVATSAVKDSSVPNDVSNIHPSPVGLGVVPTVVMMVLCARHDRQRRRPRSCSRQVAQHAATGLAEPVSHNMNIPVNEPNHLPKQISPTPERHQLFGCNLKSVVHASRGKEKMPLKLCSSGGSGSQSRQLLVACGSAAQQQVLEPIQKQDEPKKAEPTLLDKQFAPILISFINGWYDVLCFQQYRGYALMPTGNTINLFMQMGSQNYTNATFLFAAVVSYWLGLCFYKYLDIDKTLKAKQSAMLIFFLHVVSDQLRLIFPASRFTALPLIVSGGFLNALSVGRLGGITSLMHGQYQGLTASFTQWLARGHQSEHIATFTKHFLNIGAFAFGLFAGGFVGLQEHPYKMISNQKFAVIGALYAFILVVRDTPRPRFMRIT